MEIVKAPFDGVVGRRTEQPICRPGERVLTLHKARAYYKAGERVDLPGD